MRQLGTFHEAIRGISLLENDILKNEFSTFLPSLVLTLFKYLFNTYITGWNTKSALMRYNMSNYDNPDLRYSSLSEPIEVLCSHPHSLTLS